MTSLDHHRTHDPALLAAAARSILACPASVNLVVEGVDDVLAGPAGADPDQGPGLQDQDGRPTFSCAPDSALALAGAAGRQAIITLESGLGAAGSSDRDAVLTLAGRLESAGREACECCTETREVVVLHVTYVLLTRASNDEQLRVPVGAFESPSHVLNRGFLQRSVEHANLCHQLELRRAVATLAGVRVADVVGVALTDLRPDRVEIRWVGLEGADTHTLRFTHPARTTHELGELLRDELHAGLC